MADKKERQTKPKIEIKTRKPEKRGIFDNIGNDRSKDPHPLRDILNFPDLNTLDSQTTNSEISKPEILGNPSPKSLDSQKEFSGYPNKNSLDSQTAEFGNPKTVNLDSQAQSFGNPNLPLLDIKIAKEGNRISKKPKDLDIKIAKEKVLDSQTGEKKTDWSKYDKKRQAKGVFLRTSDEITKRFKQFCIGKDWDFSYGTELAWNKLMTDLDIQTEGNLDSLIAHDDRRLKMLYKTRPFIINLYLRYNTVFNELSGNAPGAKWSARWTARDDETAQRYNDIAPEIIELGIIQTQTNKGLGQSRIQTFKYYVDEIEKVLTSGVSDEMLGTILKYHRQLWKNLTDREVDLNFLDENKA